MILSIIPLLILIFLGLVYFLVRKKNMDVWLLPYIRQKLAGKPHSPVPKHILFCYVDHYEPMWRSPELDVERRRVDRWVREYPELCRKHRDADGRFPQHTFFYPEEEYREEHLSKLESLCRQGYGEIEIHLHHDDDTSENLAETLVRFKKTLHEKHGALPVLPETGEIAYAFIHGNWCLDNSRRDGKRCGVNDELQVLRRTGCYVDMTLPSAPDESQTKTINQIYYAKDDPEKPKSHDTGKRVRVGGKAWGDLMILQGPLALNWKKRKMGLMPKIENGDIKGVIPPDKNRVDMWVDCDIHVEGRPEWVFVKIHTHGAQERDMDVILGKESDEMFSYLESRYNDGRKYVLHYVSAREMYNIAKAAEAGCNGNPDSYRDFVLAPPDAYKYSADG